MSDTLWFTAVEIARVQAILPGVDLTRCDDSGYLKYAVSGDDRECTPEHPCRIHRVVQLLDTKGDS